MSNMDIKKLAGYCLILGPILALVCFFIQPGGVLGIGGSAEPLDFAGQIQIAVDNSMLGILTAMLIPVGLISLFSGIFYYVRSMEGGNGHAISSLSTPFFLSAIIGWSIANGIWVGRLTEIDNHGAYWVKLDLGDPFATQEYCITGYPVPTDLEYELLVSALNQIFDN